MASKVPLKKACQNLIGFCGASRWHKGKQGRPHKNKRPITPTILHQLQSQWPLVGEDYEQTMLWAAATVFFFGFMRAGELMMTLKKGFNPFQHLALNKLSHGQPTTTVVQRSRHRAGNYRWLLQESRHRAGNYR